MGRERTERERRELEDFAEAVRAHTRAVERAVETQEEAIRSFNEVLDRMLRVKEFPLSGPSPLPEEEVAQIADKSVHEVRLELQEDRRPERGPLTDEEVKEWEHRREERRRREG